MSHQYNQQKVIVVGQGLCGSFLSYYLYKAGVNFVVYDVAKPFTSTKVASGVINPVTGRRIVRTWMIETIMPFAVQAYREMEKFLQLPIIKQCNILDFHTTPQMQLAFTERLQEEKEYLQLPLETEHWRKYFNYPFGIGETNPCWLIDLSNFLLGWRKFLQTNRLLIEEEFTEDKIDPTEITIFCDGVNGFENSYFKKLPYAYNKGQALISLIDNLPQTHIFKHGLNIVPWKEKNLWWIGSSYEWNFNDTHPTEDFKNKIKLQLHQFLKVPFKVIDHIAALRPANLERRPFVGLHPIHQHIGILNGMGTKGCSLAPYFAHQLTQHVLYNSAIQPEANVQRFTKILSK